MFGRLTVGRRVPRPHGAESGAYYECMCACGSTTIAKATKLRAGNKLSCGCAVLGSRPGLPHSAIRHGHAGEIDSPTYRSWRAMLNRCERPADQAYDRYGGRGISVCGRWHSFQHFLADMGERPTGRVLDRYPDNNGNYEPGNVRWATREQSANNTRANHILTFRDEQYTVGQLARLAGIGKATFLGRINRGWSVEEAVARHPKNLVSRRLIPTPMKEL